MNFISTIVHSVREIRSNVHRTGTGRMPNTGPPVITIIQHKPGYWAAYGLQSLVCALLVAASIGGIVYVAVLRLPGPFRVGDLMFTPFGVMILIGAVTPVYFVRRFRQLQRVFDSIDENLEPGRSGLEIESDTPERERAYETDEQITKAALAVEHPNIGVHTDPAWIMLTAMLLMATGALQLVSGIYLSFTFTGPYGAETLIFDESNPGWLVFGVGQLVQCGVNFALGFFVVRHHAWSVALGLILSVINLALAMMIGHPFWFGLTAGTVLLLAVSTYGFRSMNTRIAEPHKSDPLEVYYHNLMLALVRVMRADGHCHRTELQKISRLCNNMNLSAYEQYVVMAAANASEPEPLDQIATRFLDAAEGLDITEPGMGLMLCGYAVAGADGQVVAAEAAALEKLARAVGIDPANLVSRLAGIRVEDALTEKRARALLDVQADTPPADVDTAYQQLSSMLSGLSFDHLGKPLAEVVHGHRAALATAYELLTPETPERPETDETAA